MTDINIAEGPAGLAVYPLDSGKISLDLRDMRKAKTKYSYHDLTLDEARAIRDALNEALGEDGTSEPLNVGTAYVNIVPMLSEFSGDLRNAIRAEVQSLAEGALDYAVKPAARQALANLAGAAELALEGER